jgi:hypothetical protein
MGQRFPFTVFGGGRSGAGSATTDTSGRPSASGLKPGTSASLFNVTAGGGAVETVTVDAQGKASFTTVKQPGQSYVIDGTARLDAGPGQVVAPAAPTMTLTAGNGQVSIAWTDGANGGSAITSHGLYRGTSSGNLQLVGFITTGSPYVDTGLTNGTTYIYQLSAKNGVGESVRTAEIAVTANAAETGFLGTTGYRFASSRPRPAIVVGAVAAGLESQVHRMEWYSPPYVAREFMAGLPSHYTKADGTTPSEVAAPSPINFEGLACHAFIGGSWVTASVTVSDATVSYNGASSFTLNPSTNDVGVLVAWAFNVDVPAGTKMLFTSVLNVAAGASMIAGIAPTAVAGRLDACLGQSTSYIGALNTTGALSGTDARTGGGMYTPAFIVAKPKNGLATRVFWWLTDSKGFGRSVLERYLDTPMLSLGFIALAMDESTIGGRAPCGITGVPGTGIPEWKLRTGWNRKLDLIKRLPNRPYTDIGTDHYNNGNVLDANYRASFSQYYDLILTESRNWGDTNAKLHQTRPIPAPRSTDFATTLAGQPATGTDVTSTRFAGFDADLLANYFPQITSIVNMNRDYAYDQTTNRDKIKSTGVTRTLAAAYVANASTIQFNEQPSLYEYVVLDPTVNTGAGYVRAISGTGPYTATLFPAVNKARAQGDIVPITYVGDRIGLHPANQGHALLSTVLAEWKRDRLTA